MGDNTAIVPQVNTSVSEQVEKAIEGLKPAEDKLAVISAKNLSEVLPAKFYEGASGLQITTEERDILEGLQDAPDDDIDIRPNDGLIYASHMYYRRALTRIFGTEWAVVPGSPVVHDNQKNIVYQRWVLVVRGHYVGEAIGAATYLETNPKADKSWAAEGAQSEAIRRICAKSALGIGSNTWDKRFQQRWRKEHAVKVWVKYKGERQQWWRRIDSEPFEDEIADPRFEGKKTTEAEKVHEKVEIKPVPAATPTNSPAAERVAEPNPQPSPPTPKPKPPEAPKQEPAKSITGEPRVTDANWRWLMVQARQRKLVVGEDGGLLINFLCQTLNIEEAPKAPGKTSIEVAKQIFLERTMREYLEIITPAMRQK